jgi:hypothetical protein
MAEERHVTQVEFSAPVSVVIGVVGGSLMGISYSLVRIAVVLEAILVELTKG